MSQIHVRQIRAALERTFAGVIDLSDCPASPDRTHDTPFLTRALAAFVLQNMAPELEPADAAAEVTDGTDDNGVDALHCDKDAGRIVVVQSKWREDGRKPPESADVHKFIQGVRDLADGRFDRFNVKIQRRADEITGALDEINTRLHLVLAHTGSPPIGCHAQRLVDDVLREFNDPSEVMSFQQWTQDDVYRLAASQLQGSRINLEVELLDWGTLTEPYLAYYGQVRAVDVAAWWDDHGGRLFDRNLRRFLSDSQVNDAIVSTLLTEPKHFWYFNNGITVLAEKIGKKPIGGPDRRSGVFVCEGVTIVNGAQTVGSIGQAKQRNPGSIEAATVPGRFISLEECPSGFASSVTRAANTQNRIVSRDFVSLDPQQERLRVELQMENGRSYVVKTGEPDPAPDLGCSVTEATVALACACEDSALAVQAKREIGRLWDDISKQPYTMIFNADLTALRMWRSVEVMRAVESMLKAELPASEGKRRAVAVHGNRLILHLTFRSLPHGALESDAAQFQQVLTTLSDVAARFLGEVTTIVERDYGTSYPASLFKNAAKCRAIADSLAL